jgi:hypothetical protein
MIQVVTIKYHNTHFFIQLFQIYFKRTTFAELIFKCFNQKLLWQKLRKKKILRDLKMSKKH